MKQEIIDEALCDRDISDYLEISLVIKLDLLEECTRCVEFPKYLGDSCENG